MVELAILRHFYTDATPFRRRPTAR